MKPDDTLQVVALVIAGGWAVVVWCVSRLTRAYRLKAQVDVERARLEIAVAQQKHQLAEFEMSLLRQRVEATDPLLGIWQDSIEHMRAKLREIEALLEMRTVECEDLRARNARLEHALGEGRVRPDPLAGVNEREPLFEPLSHEPARS